MFARLLCGLAILALLLAVALPARAERPLRIMPLGDSITHGVCCNRPNDPSSGYRAPLAQLLTEAGVSFDFVGSLQDGAEDLADRDHEGHDGWPSYALREIVPGRLAEYQPDVVLLSAGTNDLVLASDPSGSDLLLSDPNVGVRAATSLGRLIDEITEAAPATVTLVAPINPLLFKQEYWARLVPEYNALVRAEVARRAAAGARVVWVPMGWSSELVSDRVHPNAAGYRMMAAAWADAILFAWRH